ncbi:MULTISPECIES: hypothetical protein [unclassified Moorena]|nr:MULTISPECIES: hypothetical protein [unclassified Moorena]NEO15953.1 hypothetical protein [Moorena sp. SIO3E8]NEP21706.1 hypothetical protein [Moorena sp. SIO3I6]NEP99780.1 hypothetical protein [Moorena sp. SIO3F7]
MSKSPRIGGFRGHCLSPVPGLLIIIILPDSRFPTPDSRFPIPDSRFPIP